MDIRDFSPTAQFRYDPVTKVARTTAKDIGEVSVLWSLLYPHLHNWDNTECMRNATTNRCKLHKKLRRDIFSDWMGKI